MVLRSECEPICVQITREKTNKVRETVKMPERQKGKMTLKKY